MDIKGEASNGRELLKWVKKQFEGDDIEDINAAVLDKIIKGETGSKEIYGDHGNVAVLFCKIKKNLLSRDIHNYFRQERRWSVIKGYQSYGEH